MCGQDLKHIPDPPQVEEYLEEVREAGEKEPVNVFNGYKEAGETLYQKQLEIEVMLTVAECSRLHNLGKLYRKCDTFSYNSIEAKKSR